ncbi:hypothetical protein HCG51_32125 [Tolypothrix sp. PCC 7910]|uniref:hypothetical protein n=1 Tax=Tolypothrix sp. PCC 7910 TaxID=2099387 RepID=UPI0014278CE9|nr:hypothetical protein [Tolypothrix sp. PCC 7910]QIR40878.1 hypothetical protein HCG51_32125 [Tolypothrix sp. PCC 7910]
MKSQENPSVRAENNYSLPENTPDYMNSQKPQKSEPITQVQKENVITSEDLPNRRFRYGFPLIMLTILVFVAALYYGIINP